MGFGAQGMLLKLSLTVRFVASVSQRWPLAVQMCAFTLQQGGYEGRGHAAGTEQHGMAHLKLPLWDPPQNNSRHGRQESHHRCLYLGDRGDGPRKHWPISLHLHDKPKRNLFVAFLVAHTGAGSVPASVPALRLGFQ